MASLTKPLRLAFVVFSLDRTSLVPALESVASMRLGVVILPDRDWSQSSADWRRAEELGFAHAWTYDHLTFGRLPDAPWYAAVPTLAAAALATRRIRLGTLVATPNLRHPVPFAQDLLTLERLSGGRLIAGIGSGGKGPDSRALAYEAPTPMARAERFTEFTEILAALLRGDLVERRGHFYEVGGARLRLPSAQPAVPLLIAATGPRGINLAARHAAIWATSGPDGEPQLMVEAEPALREQSHRLDDACTAVGRDPSTIDRLLMTGTRIRDDLVSVDAFTDIAGRAREIGFTDLVVHWPRSQDPFRADIDVLERIAANFL
jgi:alkanesulfonate monooxygenase SsuD/methylene tetrahydromethanopterin reductase-like flavin-dependent oxidoreductase (luciferase family)